MNRVLAAFAAVFALALAACSSTPAHVTRSHGLGGSSVVHVDAFDVGRTQILGRPSNTTPGELASRLRTRLLQQLRDHGFQTRDADGDVARDGITVQGTLDVVDGGATDGVGVGGQRLHCTVRLFNGREDRDDPAAELKITGTPALYEVTSGSKGMLGAADDAADQIAKFVKENP